MTPDAHIAEGHGFEDHGRFDDALACYRRAVAAAPGSYRGHLNVGNVLRLLDRPAEAAGAFREAIDCAPELAAPRFNLASLLHDAGDNAAARAAIADALQLEPDLADAHILLAAIDEDDGHFADAAASLRRALDLRPDHAGAWVNLALLCMRENRFDLACEYAARARAIDPDLRDVESSLLFSLCMRDDVDAATSAREHRRLGAVIGRLAGAPYTHWDNVPDQGKRLRVGYVSGDFGPHPVALFLRPVLEHHDRRAFEIVVYSNGPDDNPVVPTLRAHADRWRNTQRLRDRELAEAVRDDSVDILVDLSGHTNRNRLPAFGLHPAPVQATWLGYLGTTGLAAMDYRICDRHTDPPGATEHLHTERLHRLPDSQWCYSPWAQVPLGPASDDAARGPVVFGSFNQMRKISTQCLELWCGVLAALPDARLVLLDAADSRVQRWLAEGFARRGIAAERIEWRGRLSIGDYYAAIGEVDIALDTLPYNGGTTTLDALWMGVPVVALTGERSISRGASSILFTVGLPELVADSMEATSR